MVNITFVGLKHPNMKVTENTRICSAHFTHDCTIPNVRSPSQTKEEPACQVLIQNSVKTMCTCMLYIAYLNFIRSMSTPLFSEHLEHANDAMK